MNKISRLEILMVSEFQIKNDKELQQHCKMRSSQLLQEHRDFFSGKDQNDEFGNVMSSSISSNNQNIVRSKERNSRSLLKPTSHQFSSASVEKINRVSQSIEVLSGANPTISETTL